MSKLSDDNQELIAQIKAGKKEAIGQLYSRYRAPFLTWAMTKYLIDEATALDIFQEVAIVFYRNIAQGKLVTLTSNLKTYLFAIGKNLILKHLRDRKEWVEVEEQHLPEIDHLDIFKQQEQSDQKERIRKALKQLGEPCNEIIQLFYYRGVAMEIIKERLGYKNEAVARTQKKRCMHYLRQLILKKTP